MKLMTTFRMLLIDLTQISYSIRHVIPFCDIIGYILHDVQANSQGTLTLEVLTPVDPRLKALDSTTALYSTSLAPIPLLTAAKTLYN
jgi:hypothetical protein